MLGRGPDATFGDIDDAVAAARKAPPGWATTPTPERAQALKRLAGALEARAHAIGELCTRETGAPITSRIANGVVPAALIRYYAALICETDDEEIFRTDVVSMG
jgi:acyl-CoA reductase-like NAD-dependent aldehyde dehydrogenase